MSKKNGKKKKAPKGIIKWNKSRHDSSVKHIETEYDKQQKMARKTKLLRKCALISKDWKKRFMFGLENKKINTLNDVREAVDKLKEALVSQIGDNEDLSMWLKATLDMAEDLYNQFRKAAVSKLSEQATALGRGEKGVQASGPGRLPGPRRKAD